jgi:mannose-6-phosphate isomerase-like protein (cupin superfamily)
MGRSRANRKALGGTNERHLDATVLVGRTSPPTCFAAEKGNGKMNAQVVMDERAIEQAGIAARRHYNPIQQDSATFLKMSAETGGASTLIEVEVAPGGGNMPHYHTTYAEHFEVVRGTLEVTVAGKTLTLRPGDTAIAPLDTAHNFHNPTDRPTTFLVTLRPGSPGFEKSLQIGYGLARDGLTTSKGLLEMSEMRVAGPFNLVKPLFRFLARRARQQGIDRDLEARYCR